LDGDLGSEPTAPTGGTILSVGEREATLPRLGLQISSEVEHLTDAQLEFLKALHLDHLRVTLPISDSSCVDELQRATRQAKSLGVSLQVCLSLGQAPQFAKLLAEIEKLQPPVSCWLVTGSDPADFQKAHEQLLPVAGNARIGVTH